MLKPLLLCAAVAAAITATPASAATLSFDGLASCAPLTTAFPGVTLRELRHNVTVGVANLGSNGVLAPQCDFAFNESLFVVEAAFSTPQRSVSVSAAAWREFYTYGSPYNRPYMDVFDTAGNPLARVLYSGVLPSAGALSAFEPLTYVSTTQNIGSVRLSAQNTQGGAMVDGVFESLAFSTSAVPTATVYDDFSAAPRRWTLSGGSSGITSSVSGGRLWFELDPAASGSTIWHRYDAVCALRGDFDLQVDYTMKGKQTGVRAALAAWGAGHAERSSLSAHDIYTAGEYYITNISGYVPGFVPTLDSSGGLRLVRTGNLMTSYYRSGSNGGWKPIYSQVVSTADLPFGLQVWTHDWAYAGMGGLVSFDNVLLASGRFVPQGKTSCPQ